MCIRLQSKHYFLIFLFTESIASKSVTVYLLKKTVIDYQCTVCFELFTEPLAEPFITDCGHHLCQKCLNHLLDSSKTVCPTCREPNMLNNARRNKYLERVVKSLKVRCSYYKEGCAWVGELKDLHDHVIGESVACPFGCGNFLYQCKTKEHCICHCH